MVVSGSLPFVSSRQLLDMVDEIAAIADQACTPNQIRALRSRLGADRAGWVIALAALQRRAREKWGDGVWMVTDKAIAQATDRRVARYKAAWMGDEPVWDLCGGVGGDAMELARRGPLVSIDADPQITAMAAANLELDRIRCSVFGVQCSAPHPQPLSPSFLRGEGSPSDAEPGASARRLMSADCAVVCADVTRYPIPPRVAIHVDPDRRPATSGRAAGSQRVVAPDRYQPPLGQVVQWVTGDGKRSRAAVVKLAPAAHLDNDGSIDRLGPQTHRQWISVDGSVREQVLLCGECVDRAGVVAGGRSAVRLMNDGAVQRFATGAVAADCLEGVNICSPFVNAPLGYLFDIDPAVRAAGLSAAFARHHDWRLLGSPAGFFTADILPIDRDLMQCFAVLWSGPVDAKRILQAFANQAWWPDSVKVRARGHDPEQWLRRLRSKVSWDRSQCQAVTLLIGQHAQGFYAAIGCRC